MEDCQWLAWMAWPACKAGANGPRQDRLPVPRRQERPGAVSAAKPWWCCGGACRHCGRRPKTTPARATRPRPCAPIHPTSPILHRSTRAIEQAPTIAAASELKTSPLNSARLKPGQSVRQRQTPTMSGQQRAIQTPCRHPQPSTCDGHPETYLQTTQARPGRLIRACPTTGSDRGGARSILNRWALLVNWCALALLGQVTRATSS